MTGPARHSEPADACHAPAALAQHPFLKGIDPALLPLFEAAARRLSVGPRETLFEEGADATCLYLVCSGMVDLQTYIRSVGRITIDTVRAGGALGWSWLFAPYRWHFTATTDAPTDLIVLDGIGLREQAHHDASFGFALLGRVSLMLLERLHATQRQLVDLHGLGD